MAGFDRSVLEGLRRLGGEPLVERLVEIYHRDAPVRLAEIREATARNDPGAAGRAAHTLISLAGNLGATRLKDLAALTEKTAEEGCGEVLKTLVDQLEAAHQEVCAELAC